MSRKIFALGVTLLFFYIAFPLLFPISMGGVLAVLLTPPLDYIEKKLGSRMLGSSLLTFGTTILFILPTAFLTFFSAKIGFLQLQSWKASPEPGRSLTDVFLNHPSFKRFMHWVNTITPVDLEDFSRALHDLGTSVGGRLAELFGSILTQIPGMILFVLFMILSLYFFLIDGRKLIHFVRQNTLFSPAQTNRLISTIGEMCRSVVLAAVVSGALQSVIECIACALTSTPNIPLIGLAVFVASFIPLVGSLPVTVAVGIQQLWEGQQMVGVTLLIAGVIVFAMDNAVRSLFLRGSTNLHPFLAFVAAIGGLQTLGFVGVFLGPICAVLLLTTLKIVTQAEDAVSETVKLSG